MKKRTKYERFLDKGKLIDQTVLVNGILAGASGMYTMCNSSWYKACTSKGIFEGTDTDYLQKLLVLQRKLDAAKNALKRIRLRNDIAAIEDGYRGERRIERWYAVPQAIALRLQDAGYVILYFREGSWLGKEG